MYNHVVTDGRTLFTSPQNVKVIPDVFPGAYAGEAAAEGERFTEDDMLTALQEDNSTSQEDCESRQIRQAAVELRSCLAARGDSRADEELLTTLTGRVTR